MSVLDERIRRIAREEAAGLTGSDPEAFAAKADAVHAKLAAVEEEVARLRARLDELEKAPASAPKRAPRKATEPSE